MKRRQKSSRRSELVRRDQRWIDEALASGPEKKFSWGEFNGALRIGLKKAATKA
jgi:hypothetical protein